MLSSAWNSDTSTAKWTDLGHSSISRAASPACAFWTEWEHALSTRLLLDRVKGNAKKEWLRDQENRVVLVVTPGPCWEANARDSHPRLQSPSSAHSQFLYSGFTTCLDPDSFHYSVGRPPWLWVRTGCKLSLCSIFPESYIFPWLTSLSEALPCLSGRSPCISFVYLHLVTAKQTKYAAKVDCFLLLLKTCTAPHFTS
jgi:hypothetical protein